MAWLRIAHCDLFSFFFSLKGIQFFLVIFCHYYHPVGITPPANTVNYSTAAVDKSFRVFPQVTSVQPVLTQFPVFCLKYNIHHKLVIYIYISNIWLEMQIPPDLPSNCSSLRDLNCTHSNYETLVGTRIVIYCHYLSVLLLGNLRACCLPWKW